MSVIGNVIWFLLGGAITGVLWGITGILWGITIVGIPVAKQCFKISKLCFCPFGKTVIDRGHCGSFFMNLIWILTTGWGLALEATSVGIICCITIIGIPFGKQYFKIARLAIAPFGATIEKAK